MAANSETKRRRGSAATKAAILDAAKLAFTQESYEAVGLRAIAARAGVDASLVNRYFGTKQALFAEVMDGSIDIGPYLNGDRATFGWRIAHGMVTTRVAPGSFRPLLVMIRSAPNAEAGGILRAHLNDDLAVPLAAWLGGHNAQERAGLILAQLAGFFFMRTVIGLDQLEQANEESLVSELAAAVQLYVDGDTNGVRLGDSPATAAAQG